MDIQVIDRNEEILDPSIDLTTKCARMARLCYRVDKDNGHETDVRILTNCIKSGHESVIEHGIISLFINNEITADSKKFAEYTQGNVPVPFASYWNSIMTETNAKYCERYDDPDIFDELKKVHKLPDTDKRILPCLIADVRAWRQIIRERLLVSGQRGDCLMMILLFKVVKELQRACSPDTCMFQDVIDTMNQLLADENARKGMLLGDPKLDTYTVDSVADYYFQSCDTVFAAPASPTASLSVIITTERALTHQLVRHRKNVAYSQESQRYVNYDKKGYRVIPLTVESSKYPDDFIEDYNLGKVRSTSAPYIEWKKAMEDAFEHYHNLLNIYEGTGEPEIKLPPETCRGVLPNDTATRIGVTWMNKNAFINFVYWRLDSHAQYAIRSMIARIIYKAKMMGHPFIESIPYGLQLRWLNSIRDQKLFNGQMAENLDKIIAATEAAKHALESYIEKLKKQDATGAEKSAE